LFVGETSVAVGTGGVFGGVSASHVDQQVVLVAARVVAELAAMSFFLLVSRLAEVRVQLRSVEEHLHLAEAPGADERRLGVRLLCVVQQSTLRLKRLRTPDATEFPR